MYADEIVMNAPEDDPLEKFKHDNDVVEWLYISIDINIYVLNVLKKFILLFYLFLKKMVILLFLS